MLKEQGYFSVYFNESEDLTRSAWARRGAFYIKEEGKNQRWSRKTALWMVTCKRWASNPS